MTIDIFDEILCDGTDEEIESLANHTDVRSSYDFIAERDCFIVRYGSEIINHYGPRHTPNCVSVLGPSFVFVNS